MAQFGFNFPLNGFGLNSLVYLFINGLVYNGSKVHKGFGLVFVLYKWFGSVQFGFKAKKPNRTETETCPLLLTYKIFIM